MFIWKAPSIQVSQFVREEQQVGVLLPGLNLGVAFWVLRDGRNKKARPTSRFVVRRARRQTGHRVLRSCGRRRRLRNFGASGKGLRMFDGEGRIKQEQGLLRDGGSRAACAALVRAGEIEDAEQIRQVLPIDFAIDGAAMKLGDWLRRPRGRRSPDRVARQQPRSSRERLKLQPPAIHPPQEAVFGIGGPAVRAIVLAWR